MMTILVFIIILGILVLAHEFGHFVTAKKSGVNVEEFGVGFPPRAWSKKGKDGVIYSINWIPLGGFVKLKGEDGSQNTDPDSFANKPARVKALILSAGVIMNVILAFVLFSFGFMFGLPVSISSDQLNDPNIYNVKIQISGVIKDSAADIAGIKIGDQVVMIDGAEMKTIEQVQEYIQVNQENELNLMLINGGKITEVKAAPFEIKDFSEGKVLGVNLVQTGTAKYGFFKSWYRGAIATWNIIVAIVVAFYNIFKDLFAGLGLSAHISGPVGVAVIAGQVITMGWIYVLQFAAVLSLNLAVLNFLPFPALDGGRFLFLIIEKIRRKPNNRLIENMVHNIGFTLLMLLVVFVTYRDIVKFGGGFIDRIKNMF